MRALVTGGAGFIGSTLVDHLVSLGYDVDILDNLSTGLRVNLQESPRVLLHFGSAQYPPILTPLVKRADVIFHLAAIVGVKRVLEMPLETVEQNVQATACVLHCAASRGVPTVLTSSSEVYGRSEEILLSESDDLRISPNGRWGYAAAKLVEEFIALARFATKEVPVVITRLFNTIGPRQRPELGSVVPTMLSQALAGHPITVYGDGRQERAFTWVGDTVDALERLSRTPEAFGEIVNIGAPNFIEIRDLADLIKEITQSTSSIEYVPRATALGAKFHDIERRQPDLAKIDRLIGWRPRYDIREMLDEIVATWRIHERSVR
jgi:UDP-glucose 4-epimerase